jgi:tetratricopeptide (TPR) repeat protein
MRRKVQKPRKPAPHKSVAVLQSQLDEAIVLHQRGKLARAQALYEKILKAQPSHFDALHLLGVLAIQAKNHQLAVDLIDQAIAIFPQDAAFYNNRGIALKELRQLDAAVASFNKAIALKRDFAKAYSNRGAALLELKQLDVAVASFDEAIALKPDLAEAHNNRGNALLELMQLDAAIASFDKAILVKPDFAEAYNNRGNASKALKRLDAAIVSYDKAIAIKPHYFEAHYNRGTALRELRQPNAAIASFNRAITIKPDYAKAYSNRGVALQDLKQLDAAIASFDTAIALNPHFAEAHYNRGVALLELKQLDAAVVSFDKAITLKPDYAEAHNNCGVALLELRQPAAAVTACEKAIAIQPRFAEAYNNLGNALLALKSCDAAAASYERAIGIRPDYAEAYHNLGNARKELGDLDAAAANCDKAIAIKLDFADAYWTKGSVLLLKGNFAQGFELLEWRWKRQDAGGKSRNFVQPLWLGKETLEHKTILLHSEQGLGDTIQFCRYARQVAEKGASVILEVPKPLVGLLQELAGVSQLVEQGKALPAFDYHCPLMSLPLAFNTTLDAISNPFPYLRPRKEKVEFWSKKLGVKTRARVGLVWSGNARYKSDQNRSFPLESLLPYLPGEYEYICLQKDLRQIDEVPLRSSSIAFLGDRLGDFTDTAALCELMDAVISVDTSVAHLSGALGRPTWILLPYAPDWRWLLDRDDSPWYSSAKLYRQGNDFKWDSVFERMRGDLEGI